MKNILQAAALIVMAASAIVAAATSRHHTHEQCNYEWESAFEKISANHQHQMVVANDSNLLNQSQIK